MVGFVRNLTSVFAKMAMEAMTADKVSLSHIILFINWLGHWFVIFYYSLGLCCI